MSGRDFEIKRLLQWMAYRVPVLAAIALVALLTMGAPSTSANTNVGTISTVVGVGPGFVGDGSPVDEIMPAERWQAALSHGDTRASTASKSPFAQVQAAAFTSCPEVSEIPTLECEALVALYNATDGPNWTNNSGWLETDAPCSWHGVTCSVGHVTELNLDFNQLSGSIPAELGDLSNLTDLLLNRNQLSGSIPVELGNLSNLGSLGN